MDQLVTIDDAAYSVADALAEGLRHHQSGSLAQAETIYRRILAVDPINADSLHLRGLIAYQAGQKQTAVALIGRAVELKPTGANYHNNLGNALRDLGRVEDALRHFRIAIELRPHSPEIHCNLANALRDCGDHAQAIAHYREAVGHRPESAELHYNLANALVDIGERQAAEASYRAALALQPDYADAHYNLGNCLIALRRWEDAEACFRAALAGRPTPASFNNLGIVLNEQNRLGEAAQSCRAALALDPEFAEAHYNLGCVLRADGAIDEAVTCYEQALALKPDYGTARIAACIAQLPILYNDESEIAQRRDAYTRSLHRLCAEIEQDPGAPGLADAVGATQPFFLGYQGQDDRELQHLYGSAMCRILEARHPPARLPRPPAAGERIRVGIVSGFFSDHTVWRLLIRGWLERLDRRRFAVFGYHTGTREDGATAVAASGCDRFHAAGTPWREAILDDAPHVLLYPEIGMDPVAAQLAAQRLAPVQAMAWGHPVTSGMPTIDYFLSSALMEPQDGDRHYTERLIRLPHLATCYEPDERAAVPADRTDFALRPGATVFWSGQALYKYLPQYDTVFPRIARALPDSQFVFIEFARSRRVTALFLNRLERAFAGFGLRAEDYCVMLPSLDQGRFAAAVGLCDVVLDTIGWSGGRSTLDCLAQDPAIVTLPGALMRSRHSAAILRRIGIDETIASTVDDYVSIAIALGQNPSARTALRRRVGAAKHRAFRDAECITALDDFLTEAAASS